MALQTLDLIFKKENGKLSGSELNQRPKPNSEPSPFQPELSPDTIWIHFGSEPNPIRNLNQIQSEFILIISHFLYMFGEKTKRKIVTNSFLSFSFCYVFILVLFLTTKNLSHPFSFLSFLLEPNIAQVPHLEIFIDVITCGYPFVYCIWIRYAYLCILGVWIWIWYV